MIHYGANEYDREKFKPIKNNGIKPFGGLWTSPVDSAFGWIDWCNDVEFEKADNEKSFKIAINEDAKIYVINTLEDLKKCPLIYDDLYPNLLGPFVNFKELTKSYDAVWLTMEGQYRTRLSDPNLYGWDCESVLFLNPDCFQIK